jgi:hypothetical protein
LVVADISCDADGPISATAKERQLPIQFGYLPSENKAALIRIQQHS